MRSHRGHVSENMNYGERMNVLELDLDQKEQGPEKVVSKKTSPNVPC